jgi:calcineurin-like phosphoesterase family protein
MTLPEGDVILHCGDFSTNGLVTETTNFANWFEKTNFRYKVLVAGNHDRCLDIEVVLS